MRLRAREALAGSRLVVRWDVAYGLLYLAYLIVGLGLRWAGWEGADHIWFVDAVRRLLAGSWRIYDDLPPALRPFAPPDGLPGYGYSPLFALLMAPFVALADALSNSPLAASVGGATPLAYRLMVVPLLLADVGAMAVFRRLARAWCPAVQEAALFAGVALTLFGTGLLQISAHNEHQEGLVLLFLLLTLYLTPRRLLLGGVCAGLALAAKQTAVLELLPIGAILLAGGRGARVGGGRVPRWTAGLAWGGVAGAVFGAFLLRPFLANPSALVYAFVTAEQRRVINGPGLPRWLDDLATAILGLADGCLVCRASPAGLRQQWGAGRGDGGRRGGRGHMAGPAGPTTGAARHPAAGPGGAQRGVTDRPGQVGRRALLRSAAGAGAAVGYRAPGTRLAGAGPGGRAGLHP